MTRRYVTCVCGRGTYDPDKYRSCFECFEDRTRYLVHCILCGRLHRPEFDTCFKCKPQGRDDTAHALRQLVLHRDGYRCRTCGSQDDLQVDHIVPCAKGGKADEWNLQTLCARCNRDKGASWHVGCRHEAVRTELCRAYFLAMPSYFTADARARFMAEVRMFRRLGTWDPTAHRTQRIAKAA